MSTITDTLTATRIADPPEVMERTRTLYRLNRPTTSKSYPEPFDHLVLSLGRHGDTCVFPSTDDGRILDMCGFGYGMGPHRWLTGGELDPYVNACVEQHQKDDGAGLLVWEAHGNNEGLCGGDHE